MSEWELAERQWQRELALRLHRKGLDNRTIAARVASIGPRVSVNTVDHWVKRAVS